MHNRKPITYDLNNKIVISDPSVTQQLLLSGPLRGLIKGNFFFTQLVPGDA